MVESEFELKKDDLTPSSPSIASLGHSVLCTSKYGGMRARVGSKRTHSFPRCLEYPIPCNGSREKLDEYEGAGQHPSVVNGYWTSEPIFFDLAFYIIFPSIPWKLWLSSGPLVLLNSASSSSRVLGHRGVSWTVPATVSLTVRIPVSSPSLTPNHRHSLAFSDRCVCLLMLKHNTIISKVHTWEPYHKTSSPYSENS